MEPKGPMKPIQPTGSTPGTSRRRLRVFFSLCFCLSLLFLFCACPGGTPSGTDTGTEGTESTENTTNGDTDATQKPVGPTDDRDIRIRDIESITAGAAHAADSHAAAALSSILEMNARSYAVLGNRVTGTASAYYPRLLRAKDGTYLLFYQDGRWGPDVYYMTSEDMTVWSEPIPFQLQREIGGDKKNFVTCDGTVLSNGDILIAGCYISDALYAKDVTSNGLFITRSSDNGKTWTEMEIIYPATAWEPSVLQRADGEIQIYFTHLAPGLVAEGYHTDQRSTCAAILRSSDGGKTWQPDGAGVSPYEAWRVMQIFSGNIGERRLYTCQMPVALELHNGNMMVATETQYPNKVFKISLGFSLDNWKTRLGVTEEGPSDRQAGLWGGVAPYLSQFPSGEVVASYVSGNQLMIRTGSADGHTFNAAVSLYEGKSTSLWSCTRVTDTHILSVVSDYQLKPSEQSTHSMLTQSRLILDHAFTATDAKNAPVTVDGDNKDWQNGTDALFLGDTSQAQCAVSVASDGETLYLLCERLDDFLSESGDETLLFLGCGGKEYYKLTLSVGGLRTVERFTNGKFTDVSLSEVRAASFVGGTVGEDGDTDRGYLCEIAMPLSLFDLPSGTLPINAILNNTDKGKKSPADTLGDTKLTDLSTWISVTLP